MSKEHESMTAEKSLFDIYKQCSKLRKNWLNEIVTTISLLALTSYYIVIEVDCLMLSTSLEKWSETTLNYSAAILGFIIAGYTIVLTFSPSGLLLKAANILDKQSGLSYLRVFQFTFIEVFIYFLAAIFLSIFVKAFALYDGPIYTLISNISLDYRLAYSFLCKILLVSTISLTIFVTMKLKSFIFNIYTISMAVLRFKADNPS